ncbi:longevity assurance proteins LAG1/LAC1 [Westerdykella ornata]|uniref:Longevity assurance proteins LAG1/LAC1 n=1 Tax=Westerdykella ornata TaxID=318751 RepID=A0A6A6JBB5_WESOR|nr:longevity assurance proteins LAG1/LAC1 [Westerdykella ornata]KAF2272489.1 longevity assurance proteins LAG1/LAC1 [Westerdykella ornata]
MASTGIEPFPPLNGGQSATLAENQKAPRKSRGRNSSQLGGELPGDSGVAALATMGSPPVTPTEISRPSEKSGRRSKRRTFRRILSKCKRTCLRHTWVLPLVLALTIILLYLVNPVPSNPIAACLFLSYPIPNAPGSDAPVQYGKGARDFAFVAFYTIVLSFTREFTMQRIIKPIALWYGIKSRAKQARFMEQFYTALYFGIMGPFGVWVMSRSPIWFFNTTAMYEGFPHRTHEAVFKAYYLLQASYWAQQMIVLLLMLEAPRKDFKELVMHHFITLALIWCSYRFHFTYMGLAVYITMDISDFFLATSKVFNYVDYWFVPYYFAFFMGVWFYLRHWINLRILYSILTEFATVGPFELNWETQQYKCWISQYITFALLAALQAVNLFWWFYICRIAYRMVVWNIQEDDRSEYEESEDEGDGKETKKQKANGIPAVNGTPKVLVNGEEPTYAEMVAGQPNEKTGPNLRDRRTKNKR